MANEHERISQFISEYKVKFSKEKQRLGIFDDETENIPAEEETNNTKYNSKSFLGFGDEFDGSRQKLIDERKQDYQNYLTKKNQNVPTKSDYFETVNPDTFLGFGEENRVSNTFFNNQRKYEYDHRSTNAFERKRSTVEKLQDSMQLQTPGSNYNETFLGFGENNNYGKQKLLNERRQEYQGYLDDRKEHEFDKTEYAVHEDLTKVQYDKEHPILTDEMMKFNKSPKQRHLAAMEHSTFNNLHTEDDVNIEKYALQNAQDEKKRQHDEYFEDLRKQIEDKKNFKIAEAKRERLEDEAIAARYNKPMF